MSDRAFSHNRQMALLTAIEIPFRKAVYREKNRYITAAAIQWERTSRLDDDLYEEHQKNMRYIFDKYYKRAIVFFTSETERQLKTVSKKSALWEMLLMKWYTKAGDKAKEVAGTTREDLKRIINIAARDEAPSQVIVSQMLKVRGLSAFRADMIARTETHNAATFASLESAKDMSGDVEFDVMKVWAATIDDRTRESHIAADGQKIGLDAYFNVDGESIERPGDGSPENAINCRCVMTYERA